MNSYCKQIHVFTNTLTFVSYDFLLYMNSYIKSKASKEAAASISVDPDGNMKALLGERHLIIRNSTMSLTTLVLC